MAYVLTPNLLPPTFGEALWNMKEALVAGGWDVAASGDGTGGTYNASGDVHAPGGAYGGTLDLLNSWMRLRAPVAMSPRREFMIHHDIASIGQLTAYYSSDGTGFTGGAPSATVAPTAADQQQLTANTYDWFAPIDGTCRQEIWVGDTDENFSFFMGARLRAEPNLGYSTAFWLDVLDQAHASDPDPAVVGVIMEDEGIRFGNRTNNAFDSAWIFTSTASSSCRGWFDKGGGAAAWLHYPAGCGWGGETGFGIRQRNFEEVGGAGSDDSGYMAEEPMWYWRNDATGPGRKGVSHLFKLLSEGFGMMRVNGGPTPMTRISIDSVSMHWDGLTIPKW